MRITTGMMRRTYMDGLSSATQNMVNAQYTVQTQRQFNRVSEDPFRASQASSLERKYLRNKDYLDTIKELQSKQDAQEDAVSQISDIAEKVSKDYSVTAVNGATSAEARQSIATALRELQNSIVNSLNARYGDSFVLAGNDAQNPPFELSEDGKTLTYRGIDVNTTDPDELEQLKEWSKEATYVDLGFGLTFENDEVVSSSAYNVSVPGINLVGFGQTEEGDPKNMVLLLGEMADSLEQPNFDSAEYERLWNQFQEGANNLIDVNAQIGVRSKTLETTETRLSDMDLSMSEQLSSLVNIDPALAIMNYSYAQYTYNSALKIGTDIIGQSLLDFMK